MNTVFEMLARQTQNSSAEHQIDQNQTLLFAMLQPDKMQSIMKRYKLSTVPAFLLFANSRLVRRSTGANAAQLNTNVAWLKHSSQPLLLQGACEIVRTLGEVTLVMKGTATEPKCGFSRQAVEILHKAGISFETFDILSDLDIRSEIKVQAAWPTFPMLFVNGSLIGGIDIMSQLADTGKLVEELTRQHSHGDLDGGGDAQKELVSSKQNKKSEITDDYRSEGTSRAAITAIVTESNGDVEQAEDSVSAELRTRLSTLINTNKLMVFMKGDPTTPRCGFSRKMSELLKENEVEFGHFDILQDNEVRQGLKKYSNWPTYPQLYCQGDLMGGVDIVKELAESGELKKELGY